MNLRDFDYVIAVAEVGHFGQAAERCNVSQPALSMQIRKLEADLGVRIFERTRRRVAPTAIGEVLIAEARTLIAQANRIRGLAEAARNPLSGRLTLGMIHTIGPYLTRLLMTGVKAHLPDVGISLSEDFTAGLEARLLAGKIDAAITATPPGDGGLAEIPLFDEPFWVALPRDHPLEVQDEIALEDIDPGELLLLEDGHCLRDQIIQACGSAVGDARLSTQSTSLTTILSLVSVGEGLTVVPALALSGSWMTDQGIIVRRESSGTARREVRLIYRRSFPQTALLDRLADIMRACVPDTVLPKRR